MNIERLRSTTEAPGKLATVYRMPLIELRSRVVFTNTFPLGMYPGSGRPEPNYFMERLIDTAAREMKIDPIELRKRNLNRPGDMPFKAASSAAYDINKFTTLLDKAAEMADVAGFATRKAGSEKRGKLRGLGIGIYREVTAQLQQAEDIAPNPNGTHVAEVEVDPHTGSLEVVKYTMVNDLGTGRVAHRNQPEKTQVALGVVALRWLRAGGQRPACERQHPQTLAGEALHLPGHTLPLGRLEWTLLTIRQKHVDALRQH